MPLPTRSIVIATAGHIDHGKTTLVRALTGIDTDRLPEEKRRGITIDLGFASMELQQPDGALLRLSFVDVPGHSLFVRNMLAGAGCVPAVLLVVAADEGIKPQTVEHLAICELLGIAHGMVVITKSDAVAPDHLDTVVGNVRAFLKGSFLDEDRAPIVPASARTGEGFDAVRGELLKLAQRAQQGNSDAPLRMPLDRSFVIKGFGTVVTGTLLSGSLEEGQSLILEPGARAVRVRGLQTHNQPETSAQAGTRVAANLAGIDASEVHRGQTLLLHQTLSPVDNIDVEATVLPSAPPLKHRARVHFHAFTSETMASVSLYGYEAAQPGSTRLMRLKLDEPIVLVPGDRFVLRQPAPVATIGGGRVLDAFPEPRQRKSATLSWLEQLNASSLPEGMVLRVNRRGVSGLRLAALARESGLTLEATRRHLDEALQQSRILLLPADLLLSHEAFRSAAGKVISYLERPSRDSGTKSSQLRSQTALSPEVFGFVLNALVREQKIQVQEENVSLAAAPAGTSTRESELVAGVSQAFEAAGLAAPLVRELAQRLHLAEPEMRRIVTLLQRQKLIVRMGSDDLFVHSQALKALVAQMAPLRGTVMDVAAFKQLTGLSRKYAIPLLEYLDRERITRKQGDQRVVL